MRPCVEGSATGREQQRIHVEGLGDLVAVQYEEEDVREGESAAERRVREQAARDRASLFGAAPARPPPSAAAAAAGAPAPAPAPADGHSDGDGSEHGMPTADDLERSLRLSDASEGSGGGDAMVPLGSAGEGAPLPLVEEAAPAAPTEAAPAAAAPTEAAPAAAPAEDDPEFDFLK